METIGPFTMDSAAGILKPALGLEVGKDNAGNLILDASRASSVGSEIVTSAGVMDAKHAFDLAAQYYGAIGYVLTFRGLPCFVADCVVEHRAARAEGSSMQTEGCIVAKWTLVPPIDWIPL
jgi:hypothetical protein